MQMGMQMAGPGLNAVGSAVPQMINPDTGANIALANNQNWANYNSNIYGARTAMWGANRGAEGAAAGSEMMATGTAIGGIMGSDRRLKTDIERIGMHDALNIGIYKFRYHWDPEGTVRVGVIAQELKEVLPEAVIEVEGYLAVDYSKL